MLHSETITIAGAVERDPVRGVADAVRPLRRFQAEVGALGGVGIIPDLGDDAVVLAQDRDAPCSSAIAT